MAYANGRIPSSALGPVPGPNAGLIKGAATAYRAMATRARQLGGNMAISDGSVGRCYRSLNRQRLAKRVYGSNAAIPGTSNHGWGLAVDLQTLAQRRMTDRIGRSYGWCKALSGGDAAWEWWHLKYRQGVYRRKTMVATPTLRRGQAGPSIKKAQQMLRGKHVKGAARPNGFFGRSTQNAVKRFQKKHGLKADGVVGPRTWAQLRK